jgi:uncharacterized delta-60 repeat protein
MAKTWGIPGKRQTYLSPGEQMQNKPKVPLNANPLNAWDYKKSRYRRIDLYPKAVSENSQQGGVIPVTSGIVPDVTPSSTPTLTPTPTATVPCVEFGTGFSNNVNTTLVDSNSMILGGTFTAFSGVSAPRIFGLNLDGSINTQFSAGTGTDSSIFAIKRYDANSVLVAGGFTAYQGLANSYCFFKIDNNGTYINGTSLSTGVDDQINTIELTNDGKIYLGGAFLNFSGLSRNRIVRINSDYTLDNTFQIGTGFGAAVNTIVRQSDNKLFVGGAFTTYSGASANRMIKLNDDGSIDNTFNIGTGFNNSVNVIVTQNDGKVLVGGSFTTFSGISANRIIRLNSDGTVDSSFVYGTAMSAVSSVNSITIQPDNKILVGGSFQIYNGTSVRRLIRLNTDGTLDNTFLSAAGATSVDQIDLLPNNRILLTGTFTSYDGYGVGRIAIINSEGQLIDCIFPTRTPTPTPTRTTTSTPTSTPTLTPTLTSTPTPSASAVVSANFLLQEDGGELLQEDSGNILLEQ